MSFVERIMKSSPTTCRVLKRIANKYVDLAGYRKLGLRYEDLLIEETPLMQKAISRLLPKEQYDRAFRIRRAHQLETQHQLLPKDQWLKPEEDIPYLTPYIRELEQEQKEKHDLDTLIVKRPAAKTDH